MMNSKYIYLLFIYYLFYITQSYDKFIKHKVYHIVKSYVGVVHESIQGKANKSQLFHSLL